MPTTHKFVKILPWLFLMAPWLLSTSCSIQHKLGIAAKSDLLKSTDLSSAHIGISIYEPATHRYWYNYQADKYFVPASNTKIFSCYAGMKYLGDSITGIAYTENNRDILILPNADPTLLHPDFKNQPVISFLQKTKKNIYILTNSWRDNALGAGWSWDDYNADYLPERSPLPVYGNTIRFIQTQTESNFPGGGEKPQATVYTQPEINWKLNFDADSAHASFSVQRNLHENIFTITQGKEKFKTVAVPFLTNGVASALELIKDSTGKGIHIVSSWPAGMDPHAAFTLIKSQPSDSLFTPMMHHSDNFFAEQTLLMVSNKLLGVMNDEQITDTLLKTDFKDLPQKPSWADGSGLSRFNLFTPQDFVWVLNKMKSEFPWQRISSIFATGNTGTLTNYYTTDAGSIFAKTGTLSGVVALSGFLVTRKNKTLIFSILVNNHHTSGRAVRRAVEKFVQSLRDHY